MICQIIIEGHDEEQMQNLFEEIQNKYKLYDNCVIETNVEGEDTIIDKNRHEETGNIYIDKKIVDLYGESNE